ncbi:MAG: FAD:protein FMN transferase [Oscillospiraceae bacterium]|nr:FAD:protein FMN transferase [Oscillospiraceae bacterium]
MILLLIFLSSCSGMSVQTEYFFTMDSFAESTIITKEASLGKEANIKIREICEETEGRISRTIETSEIYRINETYSAFDICQISKETAGLLETAKLMKELTNGAFDPNLGEIIDLWGINNHSLSDSERKLPEKDDFYPALERLHDSEFFLAENDGETHLSSSVMNPPKFDLGGIGKGYALDEISDYLADTGIPNALVSVGGSSVLASGKNIAGNLWSVGIKDPANPDSERPCGFISASDKIISVSGGYERFIKIGDINYTHIIDPSTGYPADNDLLCVVVVMNSQSAFQTAEQRERLKNNGAISDALSTALYVMGKDRAISFYNTSNLDFEMILFVKDSSKSKGYDIIPFSVMFTEIEGTADEY